MQTKPVIAVLINESFAYLEIVNSDKSIYLHLILKYVTE